MTEDTLNALTRAIRLGAIYDIVKIIIPILILIPVTKIYLVQV